MTFANMSPAERMKASGLIGLIVVILFFVVHTMLGAVAPKSAAPAGKRGDPGAGAGVQPAPVTQPAPSGEAFPTTQVAAMRNRGNDASLALNIHDPFVPLAGENSGKADPAPKVKVEPVDPGPAPAFRFNDVGNYARSGPHFGSGLPNFGDRGAFNALVGGPGGSAAPQPVAVPDPPQPEIRLIGLVHGDPSVATLQVGGQMRIVRPGDALAKGWRLMSVDSETVTLRHDGAFIPLRVGGALNQAHTPAN